MQGCHFVVNPFQMVSSFQSLILVACSQIEVDKILMAFNQQ
jgi:hypothetical protein